MQVSCKALRALSVDKRYINALFKFKFKSYTIFDSLQEHVKKKCKYAFRKWFFSWVESVSKMYIQKCGLPVVWEVLRCSGQLEAKRSFAALIAPPIQ